MTAPLRVGAPSALLPVLRPVWAGLPLSVRESSAPQLVAVDGEDPAWLRALGRAVDSGALGVALVRPRLPGVAGPLADICGAAEEQGVSVVVETRWAAHPGAAEMRLLLDGKHDGAPCVHANFIDSAVTVRPGGGPAEGPLLERVLLDHIGLLRALGLDLRDVLHRRSDADSYTVVCICESNGGTTTAVLSGVRDPGARDLARVTVHGVHDEAMLTVPGPGTARPAVVSHISARGTTTWPSRFESAARHLWLRLHRAVTTGRAVNELPGLARDIAYVAACADAATSGPARTGQRVATDT